MKVKKKGNTLKDDIAPRISGQRNIVLYVDREYAQMPKSKLVIRVFLYDQNLL